MSLAIRIDDAESCRSSLGGAGWPLPAPSAGAVFDPAGLRTGRPQRITTEVSPFDRRLNALLPALQPYPAASLLTVVAASIRALGPLVARPPIVQTFTQEITRAGGGLHRVSVGPQSRPLARRPG